MRVGQRLHVESVRRRYVCRRPLMVATIQHMMRLSSPMKTSSKLLRLEQAWSPCISIMERIPRVFKFLHGENVLSEIECVCSVAHSVFLMISVLCEQLFRLRTTTSVETRNRMIERSNSTAGRFQRIGSSTPSITCAHTRESTSTVETGHAFIKKHDGWGALQRYVVTWCR